MHSSLLCMQAPSGVDVGQVDCVDLSIHGRGLRTTFRQMSIQDSSPSPSPDAACVAKRSYPQTEGLLQVALPSHCTTHAVQSLACTCSAVKLHWLESHP